MKEYSLKKWKKSDELDCLLFLALRIKELVFDYTLDTFKYPALNATSMCIEALSLIDQIENENVTEKALKPVLDELIWKLRADFIVKKILSSDLDYYINFGDYSNLTEIKIKLKLLKNKFDLIKYADLTEKELLKLVAENKQKALIDQLAMTYVTTLKNIGFSQSFIYSSTNNHFFQRNPISSIDDLEKYFQIFDNSYQEYDVIFKCSKILNEIEKTSETFNCKIKNDLDEQIKKHDKNNFLNTTANEQYFIAKKVIALDPQSARKIAEIRINKLSKLFVFYHHKEHPVWSEKALIINIKKEESFLIKEKVSAMSKGRDLKPGKAAVKLNKLIKGLKLEERSFSKYDKAIDLHGLSVENKNIENQLLQNWIALETLLVGYSQKSKIDQVIDNLTPFLKHKYIYNLINELMRDISRSNYRLFSSEIKKISYGSNSIEKFTALVALDKFKTNRHIFYDALKENPLLKYRLSQFHSLLSSPKKIKLFIDNHEKKVIWQIKRIYRTRNLIVHVGIVPNYTETLVENSHTYLDLLITSINELSIDYSSIYSIEQAIMETQIKVDKHSKALAQNLDKELDENNFLKVILNS